MTAPIAHAEFQSPSSSLSEIIRSSISTMSSSAAAHQYHLSPADRLSPSLFSASPAPRTMHSKKHRESIQRKKVCLLCECVSITRRERDTILHFGDSATDFGLFILFALPLWLTHTKASVTSRRTMDQTAALCFDSSRIIIIIEYIWCALCWCVYFIMHAEQTAGPMAFIGRCLCHAMDMRDSPIDFRGSPFTFWPCFVSSAVWRAPFFCIHSPYERGNAPQCGFILELQTHSQWFYLSVCCMLMDLLPLLVWEKLAWWILTDTSPFGNAEWRNQNICVCCLRCGQLRVLGSRRLSSYVMPLS